MAEPAPPRPKTLAELEKEHKAPPAGLHKHEAEEQNPLRNYVRDIVLGFNDGVVSVFAIVAGVVGATNDARAALVAGVAASVAGALSMGMGEYLSTKSQAEYYDAERRLEQRHIREYPELERQEMAEFFRAKGIDGPALDEVLDKLQADPEKFLDVMMREEFGISPQMGRSALKASLVVMVAFFIGAALPVLPFPFLAARPGILAATVLALGGLGLAGAVKAWVSGLSKWKSAVEMVALGGAAALVTYGVGTLLGVSV
ncbi:MAG: VIT1/CCC1 transporter family protein [Halobacteriales archaeon]|nr:VIT1/CCC1 transporter family protein [Halobacteriales archaeon]